ncbi:Hypothetical protein HVR_LOCUS1080 [uncultured virus]|nr:Hypothetical protein HVR_LOCUS1080 [uncultured virus]
MERHDECTVKLSCKELHDNLILLDKDEGIKYKSCIYMKIKQSIVKMVDIKYTGKFIE